MPETITSPSAPGRSMAWRWSVCGLLLLATMLNYMDRQTLSVIVDPYIYDEFGKSPGWYGLTESAFAMAFALGALLVGWMADRWNIYLIYPAAVAVWSLAGFATGFVQDWTGLILCRFLLGLAEAGHWPCSLRTTQHLLPAEKRSLGNGILQSGAALGAIATPFIVVGLVRQAADWPYPFWVIGCLGMAWVVLWLVWVRPRDMHDPRPAQQPGAPDLEADRSRTRVRMPFLVDRRFWVLAIVVVSINIAWHYFRAWLTQVLRALGYDRDEAILFNSAYYFAADAGSLCVGFATLFLIRRGLPVHRARVFVFAACTALTLLGVVVALLPRGPLVLVLLLVIAFGSLGLFPNYYSFTQEITVEHQGKVTGTLSCINWLAVAVLQAVIGQLVEWTGSHAVGMVLCSLAPLAGLAALVFYWETPGAGPRGTGSKDMLNKV